MRSAIFRARLGYAAALACALLFYLCYRRYLSWYLLMLTLALPLFSLAVSLPGMLSLRVWLSPSQAKVPRGEEAALLLETATSLKLPVARLRLKLSVDNQLTGQKRVGRHAFPVRPEGTSLSRSLPTDHCGALICRISGLRVCDLLGIFSLPLPSPVPRSVLVMPRILPQEEILPLLPGDLLTHSPSYRPKPGGGPSEDYEVRPYRPGDPMRTVHWKLTSKLDSLVVREPLEPIREEILILFDRFGSPEELDLAFDRLYSVCLSLLAHGLEHQIFWRDNDPAGTLCSARILDRSGLESCLTGLLSTPPPQAEAPFPQERLPLHAHQIHISSRVLEGGGTE